MSDELLKLVEEGSEQAKYELQELLLKKKSGDVGLDSGPRLEATLKMFNRWQEALTHLKRKD